MEINVSELSSAVVEALKTYTEDIILLTDHITKECAQEGVQMLKRSYATKKTGEYNSGWKLTKRKGKYIIYNAKKGYLTHILEKGYAKPNGGRVEGIPHISVVEEQVAANLEARIIREIEAIRG